MDTVEFYEVFWPQIEPIFMPTLKDFFEKGLLPEYMNSNNSNNTQKR